MVSYNDVKNGIIKPRDNTNTIRFFEKMEALQSIINDKEIQSYVWNKLYKAEILQDIRFPVGIMYEDVSAMLKIFKKMRNIIYLETPKYNYVFRENSIVNGYSHQKEEDCLSVVIDNYNEVEEFPDLDKYRCCSLILWMVRLNGFMIKANDPDNAFIKKHYDLFKKGYERHKEYIVDNLDPAKRIVLFAMLWDLDKSREVVKALYGLN